MKTVEVIVQGEYLLSATVTIPENEHEKHPAVVIVSGTGSADRDGNMKGFQMNIYKELAQFLSSLGFVTIRYDKRGVAKSKGDAYKTGMLDLVNDVISQVEFLKTLSYVDLDRIVLLGHSEGCILTTIAHSKSPVSGLILLAGAGTSLKTAMQYQNMAIVEEVKTMKGVKGLLLRKLVSEKKVAEKQNKFFGTILASKEDVIKLQFKKFPAKWLREHLSYTDEMILNLLQETDCPVLAITGEKDVQANAADLQKVEALGKDNIHCHVVKEMDHMLREYIGEKSVLNVKKQYKNQIGKPTHPQLEEEIEKWCLSLPVAD
ncbi:alpha/beta hydrolase [Bacillus sp. FJAT-42315]|uniref:alpha/beta hydrolase n=1 Tax=Bacillus sp. FJAT-42315 TaxID=2014077 RepID=UPI000C2379A4|nr:alpha/beta hydrolase [Bacillus sp. FJAT-42315]